MRPLPLLDALRGVRRRGPPAGSLLARFQAATLGQCYADCFEWAVEPPDRPAPRPWAAADAAPGLPADTALAAYLRSFYASPVFLAEATLLAAAGYPSADRSRLAGLAFAPGDSVGAFTVTHRAVLRRSAEGDGDGRALLAEAALSWRAGSYRGFSWHGLEVAGAGATTRRGAHKPAEGGSANQARVLASGAAAAAIPVAAAAVGSDALDALGLLGVRRVLFGSTVWRERGTSGDAPLQALPRPAAVLPGGLPLAWAWGPPHAVYSRALLAGGVAEFAAAQLRRDSEDT